MGVSSKALIYAHIVLWDLGMYTENRFLGRVEKVAGNVESLLVELEVLRDELKQVLAEARSSRDKEKARTLENLLAELERAYEVLKSLYRRLSLLQLERS
ncbi:MAG: hypothetical protein N3G79_04670 [Sulfolobales archaeon]|nr:hypothetical protein [Sulfolobales archaeon]